MRKLLLVSIVATGAIAQADAPPVITAVVTTAPLHNYEDAPATPDADDPAIWINRRDLRASLVIGTAKDAGLLVYDLAGNLVQALRPTHAPRVLPEDPPTPAGVSLEPDDPCPGSDSGGTFGRYNNVDVAYDIGLGRHPRAPRGDVAVISDRGCDRVRFFRIDPSAPDGPLVDITSPDVPRVFPRRYDQPSALQPSGGAEGWTDNPVDDQNTVYGLSVDRLIEPVTSFGRAYVATPDDDEFECEYDPESPPEPGDIVAPGTDLHAGPFLAADLEGLSIIASARADTLMLASSQGDSSFHFYRLRPGSVQHLGSFLIEGVGDTDGVHYAPVPLGRQYPLGLLVVQNGEAPEPRDTSPINGYEFDGSTQFMYVNFAETLRALRP